MLVRGPGGQGCTEEVMTDVSELMKMKIYRFQKSNEFQVA